MIQFFLETKSLDNTCLRIRFLPRLRLSSNSSPS